VPLPADPAAGAPQLQALATIADTTIAGFDALPVTLRNPTAITSGGSMGFSFGAGSETAATFGIVEFDNANMITVTDLQLPTYPQRWWWYVGTNLLLTAGAAANTLFTARLYLDDTDPATGLSVQKVLKRNYYSPGAGVEELFIDWFVLSGGGRLRATVVHNHTAALDFTGSSYLWATRVTPES
jgi:hypothetical protein